MGGVSRAGTAIVVVLILSLSSIMYYLYTGSPPNQTTTQSTPGTSGSTSQPAASTGPTGSTSPRTETATSATAPTTSVETSALTSQTSTQVGQEDHVWFAPLPGDLPLRPGRTFTGSVDFVDMFTQNAPWKDASSQVDVFKLYGEWVAEVGDSELRQVVGDLNARGIAIAVEAGPLIPTSDCGNGVEGFAGWDGGTDLVKRIGDAGGRITFLAMDEPFAMASIYSGAQACSWSADKVASGVAEYIQRITAVSPGTIVGDTEVLWPGVNVTEYERWMDAFQVVTGRPLPFFHLDVDWNRPDWPQAARELQAYANAHGVKFGIIYNGDWNGESDRAWLSAAADRFATFEARYGGRPDQVLFQSWADKPDYVLPETEPYTFTHLILLYGRERTMLGLAPIQVLPDGTRLLTGSLSSAGGNPMVGVSLGITAKLEEGPGIYAEYAVSGIVPIGASTADVGFRVNQECGCNGYADFDIYWVRYVEGASQVNHVANWDFSRALDEWGYWGNGTLGVESSDRGSGSMLHVVVTDDESIGMNSGDFAVTPGTNYTVIFGAKITPESVGSGYLSLVFLGQTEALRRTINLEPPVLTLGTTDTDLLGSWQFVLQGLPEGTFLILATYPGSDIYWPAFAEAAITA